ncbi:hypothetical protein O6H91_18G049300 [Diphasiastrum complanatum]|uniref:Uncharacterized protein n=1 Tax=Diphasiastrum complanatum TaxID=34168 RepID=A0ACC2B0T0_DIPCM|nr:hypothetical protein O6H91_18G049300 [Diphasiastrum complanatum]
MGFYSDWKFKLLVPRSVTNLECIVVDLESPAHLPKNYIWYTFFERSISTINVWHNGLVALVGVHLEVVQSSNYLPKVVLLAHFISSPRRSSWPTWNFALRTSGGQLDATYSLEVSI